MILLGPFVNLTGFKHCVGCYLECQGEILMLQKTDDHELYPSHWGTVAGKIMKKEQPCQALPREIFEETGIDLPAGNWTKFIGNYYVSHPKLDFIYYLYFLRFGKRPLIRLSEEHQSYCWLSPDRALDLHPLIPDEDYVLRQTFGLGHITYS